MRLKDKVAIITGSSKGIGFAAADLFLQEGAKVAVCGSKLETAKQAVSELSAKHPNAQIMAIGVSVESTDEVDAMVAAVVAKWGTVDILVNNAGISHRKEITEMGDDEWLQVMNINVNGGMRCTRAVAKIMKEKGGGSIIYTSSLVSRNGSGNQSAYTTSKFAINGLMRSNARELGRFNIRVNAIAPGVVMTEMSRNSLMEIPEGRGKAILDNMVSLTALGRTATPEDLAGSYLFFASDDSKFVTGALLHCDGGIIM